MSYIDSAPSDTPSAEAIWPICAICKKMLTAYGIEDEGTAHLDVWGECHGARCMVRFSKPWHWTIEDAAAAIASHAWFDPREADPSQWWRKWRRWDHGKAPQRK